MVAAVAIVNSAAICKRSGNRAKSWCQMRVTVWRGSGMLRGGSSLLRPRLRACLLVIALNALSTQCAQAGPTPEEYVSKVGGDARIVPVGQLQIDGNKLVCGQRPTVLDNKLDDYGAAYPGFLILNPNLLAKISTPVKLWIYSH